MKKTLLLCLVLTAITAGLSRPTHIVNQTSRSETVVLLHGLVRSSNAMSKLENALVAEGYHVINHDYPSTTATIEELTKNIFQNLTPQIEKKTAVHFVTHSMGGIILRQHLETHEIPNLGKVVMLAPPSRGSEVTDKLGNLKLYQWINGPAGNQLGTGPESHPLQLKAPEFELGIIAGDRTINPILSMLIPGPDDGKVSLARVKPEVYTDYIKLHVTHACMAKNKKVIQQAQHFLKNGMFNHEKGTL